MKDMIKDAVILFVITLIAGFLLGAVYDVTKEPIAEQKNAAFAEACREVFPDAADFVGFAGDDGPTAYFVGGANADIDMVMEAVDDAGNLLGYVITVTDHEGYGGDIKLSMGITLDGVLNGISILSISETAGLGMKAGDVLVPQFEGKDISDSASFVYTKTKAAAPNEIDAISGATITTNAVVNGVNAGIAVFEMLKVYKGVS